MSDFSLTTPTQEPDLDTAMKVIYQWNYDPEVEELRRLYVKAAEAQWVARARPRLGPPDRPRAVLDDAARRPRSRSSGRPTGARSTRRRSWELTRRTAAFRLSQFLHGEQGALMVAAQLVNAVPHTDAKFYAATQTMDEARHVEVFARYIKKLDEVRPIAPPLKSHPRRDAADRRLDEEARRHADRRRRPGALQLPGDAQPDPGAAPEGPAHLRRARRIAAPRLRRAVHRALRPLPRRRRSAASSRTSRSRRRAR